MRKAVKVMAVVAVLIGMFLTTSGRAAYAMDFQIPEVVVMNLGDPDQTREFYIDNTFDLTGQLGPAKTFIFIAVGDNSTGVAATKCGKLTLTLATTAKRDYSATITFSMQGIAYGLGGKTSVISANATTPAKASKSITFNTLYGLAFITALITDIDDGGVDGEVELPAPFTLLFSLAKQ